MPILIKFNKSGFRLQITLNEWVAFYELMKDDSIFLLMTNSQPMEYKIKFSILSCFVRRWI